MDEPSRPLTEQFVVIGHIRTPFSDAAALPIQGTATDAKGLVVLLPEYAEGTEDMEGFDNIWLVYSSRAAHHAATRVVPRLDRRFHGVFATRSLLRPNPLALTCVRLLKVDGATLEVQGADMLDGSPLLDIKPYVARLDAFPDAWAGWLENRIPAKRARKRGRLA